MSHPKKTHLQAGLRILRNLKATPDRGIVYAASRIRDDDFILSGWTYSNWAVDIDS